MLSTVVDYVKRQDNRGAADFDSALRLCNEYKTEAEQYGTYASSEILVKLAENLLAAITEEEEKSRPHLRCTAMEKRYLLRDVGVHLDFYIALENSGTGPARDLKVQTVSAHPELSHVKDPDPILIFQPGETAEFCISGTSTLACDEIELQLKLSWRRNSGLQESEQVAFTFRAQKDDVDWSAVKSEQPYDHTAPVTSPEHLYGRELELDKLVRTATSTSVGSAYLYGQKRVGKTSLANALAEKLRSAGQENGDNWLVIYVGSGDYLMGDAVSTLKQLGVFLFRHIRREVEHHVPDVGSYDMPDFSNGLAPLSEFIDFVQEKLSSPQLRFLFIMDEFDDLPIEFLRRSSPLAGALFQPIREISSKQGCGFLLVGGENMQQLMVLQGDRLNKFETIRIDYLDRPEFADLVREPVKHWLRIGPEALEMLYQSCSGNPYYGEIAGR